MTGRQMVDSYLGVTSGLLSGFSCVHCGCCVSEQISEFESLDKVSVPYERSVGGLHVSGMLQRGYDVRVRLDVWI